MKPPACRVLHATASLVTLELDAIHPSVNAWMGAHWRVRQKMAKAWSEAVASAVTGLPEFAEPVRITSIYHFPDSRARDIGNYVPKFAIDGLVRGGLIKDDSSTYVRECAVCFGIIQKPPVMVMEVRA